MSRSARWSRRLATFAAALFITAVLSHRFGPLETPGLLTVLPIVAALALVAALLGFYAFFRLWTRADIGGRHIVVGLIVAALVLSPFALSLYRDIDNPALFDVSTDPEDSPSMPAAMAIRLPGMNPILPPTPEQKDAVAASYPLVAGRRYEAPYARVLQAIDALVAERGWPVVTPAMLSGSVKETTIEASAATLVLALPVDIALRITDEDTSSYVDMRSVSRYGSRDLGDNAARIVAFLTDLDAEVATMAGAAPVEPDEGESLDPPRPEPRPGVR